MPVLGEGDPLRGHQVAGAAGDRRRAFAAQGYSHRGDEKLLPGDFVIEGEANHHRKQRGWTYWLRGLDASGHAIRVESGQFSGLKPHLKQAGLEPSLFAGAGDIAAAVRIVHAVRAGIDVHHLIKAMGPT